MSLVCALLTGCLIIYFLFFAADKKKALDRQMHSCIDNASNYIETIVSNASQISFGICNSQTVSKIAIDPISATPYDYAQAYKELNRQVSQLPISESCYLYIRPTATVLVPGEGKYTLSKFYDADFLRNILPLSSYITVHTPKNSKIGSNEVVSIITRFCSTQNQNGGYLCINLLKDKLIKGVSATIPSNLTIEVSQGDRVLFREGTVQQINKWIFEEHNNIDWYGLNIRVIADKSQFYRTLLVYFLKTLLFSLLFLVVISMFFALVFRVLNKTFRSMVIEMAKLYQKDEPAENLSIEDLTFYFNRLVNDHKDNTSRLCETAWMVKEKLLFDLLTGNIPPREEFARLCKLMNLSFPYNWYIVACAHIGGDIPSHSKTLIKAIICKFFERNDDIMIYTTVEDTEDIGILINYDEEYAEKISSLLGSIVEQVQNLISEKSAELFVSFSKPMREVENLAGAHVKAKYNLRFRYVFLRQHYIFDETQDEPPVNLIPSDLRLKVLSAMDAHSYETVYSVAQSLLTQYACNNKKDLDMLRFTYISIAGMILERAVPASGLESLSGFSANLKKLLEASSVGEMNHIFCLFVNSASKESFATDRPGDMNQYIAKAIEFITANYDKDLCINDIAEYLNLNPKYLSRLFKDRTNQTIMQFLSAYRMKKAAELLLTTTLTIREIGELTGFSDSRSFIRHFKNAYGTTPGDFRRHPHPNGVEGLSPHICCDEENHI